MQLIIKRVTESDIPYQNGDGQRGFITHLSSKKLNRLGIYYHLDLPYWVDVKSLQLEHYGAMAMGVER